VYRGVHVAKGEFVPENNTTELHALSEDLRVEGISGVIHWPPATAFIVLFHLFNVLRVKCIYRAPVKTDFSRFNVPAPYGKGRPHTKNLKFSILMCTIFGKNCGIR